jgi:serine-type D-Ala-D-Ala carboxypeptidase/endopeptidase
MAKFQHSVDIACERISCVVATLNSKLRFFMASPGITAVILKVSACCTALCLITSCTQNKVSAQFANLPARGSTPAREPASMAGFQPPRRPPGAIPPEGRQWGGRRTVGIDKIISQVAQIAPRLIDKTGRSMDSTPGFVFGVVTEEGKVVRGFGSGNISTGQPPVAETLFGIGSVTKVFTGVILADAVRQGKVNLDVSANTYLPDDLQLPSNKITLRQLVSHTSGLPNYPDNLRENRDMDRDGASDSNQYSPGRNYSRQHLAEWLASKPALEFEPGQHSQYSNLGFGILALALQSKFRFSDFHSMNRSFITQPLSMKRTQTNTGKLQSQLNPNQAQGYAPNYGSLVPVPLSDMGVLEGAGELVSTANDLLLFLEGLTGLGTSAVTPAFREASRPLVKLGDDAMAYGFKIRPSVKGGVYYIRSGSTAGYSAIILWRTNPKIGIVLLANRGNFMKINQLGALFFSRFA